MSKDIFESFTKLLIIGFCLCLLITTGNCKKIDELMTKEEIQSVFNTNANSVPDYEIVWAYIPPIPALLYDKIHKQLSYHLDLTIFSSKVNLINLYLEETHSVLDKNTPVFAAVKDDNYPFGIKYEALKNVWPENQKAYQDVYNKAALIIETDANGKMFIDGLIGYDTVIKPIPTRLRPYVKHLHGYETNDHVIYKINRQSHKNVSLSKFASKSMSEIIDKIKKNNEKNDDALNEKLDIVYPEILSIVDYDVYTAHGKNLKALTKYMAAFWNAVDLRFRDLENPEVRLNLASLVIPLERDASHYMENHRTGEDIVQTIRNMSNYLREDKRFHSNIIDFTIAITNFNICSSKNGRCDSSIQSASKGRACNVEQEEDKAVALLVDNANFDGVLLATHEIGHLLGATHDSTSNVSSSSDGPVLTKCSDEDHYIMSGDLKYGINKLHWSQCSKDAIQNFLKNDSFCLRNEPNYSHNRICLSGYCTEEHDAE